MRSDLKTLSIRHDGIGEVCDLRNRLRMTIAGIILIMVRNLRSTKDNTIANRHKNCTNKDLFCGRT